MQHSLIISSVGHIALLFFMVFYGWGVTKKMESLPVPPVRVSVISVSEFDAKLSNAPDVFSKDAPKAPKANDQEDRLVRIEQEDKTPVLNNISEKLKLDIKDKELISDTEFQLVPINKSQNIILKKEPKIEIQATKLIREQQGNEKNSFTTPKMATPKARTADRIDKVAVSKSSSQKIIDIPKKAIKASDDALKVAEITEAEAPKEASTQIVPEGKKNIEIVISGAVQESFPPPTRPKASRIVTKPPIKRPKASDLLKNKKKVDQYETLLAQAQKVIEENMNELSIVETNNMSEAIVQKLAKYWEQGILSGNSNFEKYIVRVKVKVNSRGEIVGGVIPLDPKVPKGRYLIAFRQASNALISAAILPIIPDKFPAGIFLEFTFDPENGFSF